MLLLPRRPEVPSVRGGAMSREYDCDECEYGTVYYNSAAHRWQCDRCGWKGPRQYDEDANAHVHPVSRDVLNNMGVRS